MPPSNYKVKVVEKTPNNAQVVCLKVEKPADFNYKAGQFAQFMVPDTQNPGKIVKRSYSICSTKKDENIEFCIKMLEDGVGSSFVQNLKNGDEMEITGPFGKFVLEDAEEKIVFVATGVGIAPIIGMLHESLENQSYKKDIFLWFGVRSEEDIFFIDRLDELQQKYPNFKYTITLSRPSDEWQGKRGRVTDHIKNHVDKEAHYYICGSPNMVSDVRKILEESDVSTEKIHFEIF